MNWARKFFHSVVIILLTDCLSLAQSGGGGSASDAQVIQKFYSSKFVNPTPPTIQTEFRANYMQVRQMFLTLGCYRRSRVPDCVAQVRCERQQHHQWIRK
jgi:hypothetical protein